MTAWLRRQQTGTAAWAVTLTMVVLFAVPYVVFLGLWAGTDRSAPRPSDENTEIAVEDQPPVVWYRNQYSRPFKMIQRLATLSLAMSAGALGAGISIALRVRELKPGEGFPNALEVASTVALGAVFSLILTCLFVAGIVNGIFFPGGRTAVDWFAGLLDSYEETGKLVIWSLAAGFSERAIPNYLAELVRKLEKVRKTLRSEERNSD